MGIKYDYITLYIFNYELKLYESHLIRIYFIHTRTERTLSPYAKKKKKNIILRAIFIGIIVIVNSFIIINSYKDISIKVSDRNKQQTFEGTITDTTYHNPDLGWTFSFPSSCTVIIDKKVEYYNQKGNNLTNKKDKNIIKPIKLLNIDYKDVTLMSALHLRKSFPEIKSENDFFRQIENDLKNISDSSISVNIIGIDNLKIDQKDFKCFELTIESPDYMIGSICIARVTEDYILDISITYRDIENAQIVLEHLLNSEFEK